MLFDLFGFLLSNDYFSPCEESAWIVALLAEKVFLGQIGRHPALLVCASSVLRNPLGEGEAQGLFGAVHVAAGRLLGRGHEGEKLEVALKKIVLSDEAALEEGLKEVRNAYTLRKCPHTLRILDAGVTRGRGGVSSVYAVEASPSLILAYPLLFPLPWCLPLLSIDARLKVAEEVVDIFSSLSSLDSPFLCEDPGVKQVLLKTEFVKAALEGGEVEEPGQGSPALEDFGGRGSCYTPTLELASAECSYSPCPSVVFGDLGSLKRFSGYSESDGSLSALPSLPPLSPESLTDLIREGERGEGRRMSRPRRRPLSPPSRITPLAFFSSCDSGRGRGPSSCQPCSRAAPPLGLPEATVMRAAPFSPPPILSEISGVCPWEGGELEGRVEEEREREGYGLFSKIRGQEVGSLLRKDVSTQETEKEIATFAESLRCILWELRVLGGEDALPSLSAAQGQGRRLERLLLSALKNSENLCVKYKGKGRGKAGPCVEESSGGAVSACIALSRQVKKKLSDVRRAMLVICTSPPRYALSTCSSLSLSSGSVEEGKEKGLAQHRHT